MKTYLHLSNMHARPSLRHRYVFAGLQHNISATESRLILVQTEIWHRNVLNGFRITNIAW